MMIHLIIDQLNLLLVIEFTTECLLLKTMNECARAECDFRHSLWDHEKHILSKVKRELSFSTHDYCFNVSHQSHSSAHVTPINVQALIDPQRPIMQSVCIHFVAHLHVKSKQGT